MNDLRFSLRNARVLGARNRSYGFFIAVTMAVALLSAGIVGNATTSAGTATRESSMMRTVEVDSTGATTTVVLNQAKIDEIRAMPGVVSVLPWMQSGTSLETETGEQVAGALWATPRMPVGQPPVVAVLPGRDADAALADDEVLLPGRLAGADLSGLLGRRIRVEYTRALTAESGEAAYRKALVVGLYDEAIGGRDGPSAMYVSERAAVAMAAAGRQVTPDALAARVGFPKVIVEVADAGQVEPVQRRLAAEGYNASSVQSQLTALPPLLGLLRLVGQVMTGLVVLLCAGAGLSIGAGLVRSRRRDIGLLKALGFANGRITRLLALELGLFGIGAGLAGGLLGVIALVAVRMAVQGRPLLGFELPDGLLLPPAARFAVLVLIPAVAMLAGGVWPMLRAARLAPDEALRD
ncbi:ABC transporter permease [Actinoplanes bogorensis]|uniref:ABC transporter permease n=1 Tax=Paractinoplanes bogorensis TaxID=1610840 RepID=A0ABS5YM64_9ACTN|nr:ABC transporter permease [Actinoplanes bogorensis]MBU2664493.1 ABC transporter permease [Actinoplanes bogorensis]